MKHKESDPVRPTDAELEILTILWSRGSCSVREVHETIVERKPAQYTTVLKMLQIMTDKGLVVRDERERAHRYQASQSKEWTQQQLAGDLLQKAFGGSASSLMLGVLESRKTSKKELAELRRLLDERDRGRQ